jgi:hypothetical protein
VGPPGAGVGVEGLVSGVACDAVGGGTGANEQAARTTAAARARDVIAFIE